MTYKSPGGMGFVHRGRHKGIHPARLLRLAKAFNEDEPRDEHGRWTSGGEDEKGPFDKSDFKEAGVEASPAAIKSYNRWIKNMSPATFRHMMTGGINGVSVKLSADEWFSGRIIVDMKGGGIVKSQRYLDMDDGIARNVLLKLDPGEQGAGLAKQVIGSQVATYERLGLSQVKLEANINVGGYAWAKYGFVPDAASWETTRDRIGIRDETTSDPKSMWVVADSPGGKDKLLGSKWDGTLDMGDSESMNRFNAYIKWKKINA